MAEKLPIITSVKICQPTRTSTERWPIVLGCEVETESGPMILQLTSKAALDLKGILADLPPRIIPPSGTTRT